MQSRGKTEGAGLTGKMSAILNPGLMRVLPVLCAKAQVFLNKIPENDHY